MAARQVYQYEFADTTEGLHLRILRKHPKHAWRATARHGARKHAGCRGRAVTAGKQIIQGVSIRIGLMSISEGVDNGRSPRGGSDLNTHASGFYETLVMLAWAMCRDSLAFDIGKVGELWSCEDDVHGCHSK